MNRKAVVTVSAVFILLLGAYWIVRAGSLDPPGPPAPTMKTLVEVEPRTAITDANTPGDAGHMVIIAQPGSYYLTGNLIQTGAKNGIRVNADNVTIDLMGFSLIGNGNPGASFAIGTVEPHPTNTTVRNGSVVNWSADGLNLQGSNSVVEGLRVEGARGFAIAITSGIIRDCIASNTVNPPFNNGSAIFAGYDSQVVGCTATNNVSNGIQVYRRSLVGSCTSSLNGADGIYLGHGDDNRVVGNNVVDNVRNGIWADNDCTHNLIADNHAAGNDVGIRVDGTAAANVAVKNTAAQNATQNYLIVPGNDAGPVQQAATATSAWANIETP